jgi:hypothetical protein
MSPLGVTFIEAAPAAGADAAGGAAGWAKAGAQKAADKAAATIILDSFINLTSQDTAPVGPGAAPF